MASQASFDVSTGADLQEVDNAVNQAKKELIQRYDFKGSKASIEFEKAMEPKIVLVADDDFKMTALFDLLQGRLIKRGVPVKNLVIGDNTVAGMSMVRKEILLTQAIAGDKAKEITKAIKEGGFKKVTSSIQGDEVRVSAPSRDELQAVMAMLRAKDFGIELKFGNYRG